MPLSRSQAAAHDGFDALLTALRLLLGAGGRVRAPGAFDWAPLIAAAASHGVAPFLYAHLDRLPPACGRPDAPLLRAWRDETLRVVRRQATLERQAGELLHALDARGIRALPVKGIWLAERVYEQPWQRPMCDLDLLVPPDDVAAATAVLETLGYRAVEAGDAGRFDYQRAFRHAARLGEVELHWQFGSETMPLVPRPNLEGSWRAAVRGTLAGAPCWHLPPEGQLVLLCYHLVHHGFELPLRAYLDLALLQRRFAGQLSATRGGELAGEWGVTRAAALLLLTTADLFAAAPAAVLAAWLPSSSWEPGRREQLVAWLRDFGCAAGVHGADSLLAFRDAGWSGRLGLALRRIARPPAFMRYRYGEACRRGGLPLAYLQRARDLLRRNRALLGGLLRHEPETERRLDAVQARRELTRWAVAEVAPAASAAGRLTIASTPTPAADATDPAPP